MKTQVHNTMDRSIACFQTIANRRVASLLGGRKFFVASSINSIYAQKSQNLDHFTILSNRNLYVGPIYSSSPKCYNNNNLYINNKNINRLNVGQSSASSSSLEATRAAHKFVGNYYSTQGDRQVEKSSPAYQMAFPSTLEAIEKSGSLPVLTSYVHNRYSYMYGRSNKSLFYTTVAELMEEQSRMTPEDRVKIISDCGQSIINQRQFTQDVQQAAKGLLELGINKGDAVGLFAYNCYRWLVVQYACTLIGAVFNPINPSYKSHELSYVLEKGQIKVLFMPSSSSSQSNLNSHWQVLHHENLVDAIKSGFSMQQLKLIVLMDEDLDDNRLYSMSMSSSLSDKLKFLNWPSSLPNPQPAKPKPQHGAEGDKNTTRQSQSAPNSFAVGSQSSISDQQLKELAQQVEPDDTFAVYYTSGTTGQPKGARLTQFGCLNNNIYTLHRITAKSNIDDYNPRIILPLPLFHVFAGVLGAFTLATCRQASVVLTRPKYNIGEIVETIISTQSNIIFTTPTILRDMVAHLESDEFKQKHDILNFPLRTITCGGAPIPPELWSRIFKSIPNLKDATIGFGATENSSLSNLQMIHESNEQRCFSVGGPVDFTEVKVVNLKTGKTEELGKQGEVLVRGFSNMVEYMSDKERTRETITEMGWYKTGDMGRINPEGTLSIVGRIKDLIIKGGENIYPAEIESLLMEREQVELAAVFGVPDDRFGEEVCAWVKLKQNNDNYNNSISEQELINYCKDKITYFKVPKWILFTKEFPMTPTKKIQKNVLRDQTIQMLKKRANEGSK